MEISPTSTATLPSGQTGSGQDKPKISSDFETFLRMLTVQMQNQDPLNPIKSEDFAVQLATFSGVEQQVRTNDLLEELRSQLGAGGIAQVAGWVGMEARVPGAGYFDGAPITLFPSPQTGADRADLVVRDAGGTEIQRLPIAATGAKIEWTGSGPQGNSVLPGAYRFEVQSFSGGALMATEPAGVYTEIAEVRAEAGQTVVVLQGGAEFSASEISALRAPRQGRPAGG